MLDRFVAPHWLIAHQEGCTLCKGTSYYPPKDDWSFLDMILVRASTNQNFSWTLLNSSTRLVNEHPQQKSADGYPLRFSVSPLSGVSDHWPMLIELGRLQGASKNP